MGLDFDKERLDKSLEKLSKEEVARRVTNDRKVMKQLKDEEYENKRSYFKNKYGNLIGERMRSMIPELYYKWM